MNKSLASILDASSLLFLLAFWMQGSSITKAATAVVTTSAVMF
jgi:hypothetical protein